LARTLGAPRDRELDAELIELPPAPPSLLATDGTAPTIGRAHAGQASAWSETLRPQSGQSMSAMARASGVYQATTSHAARRPARNGNRQTRAG
jgi:hypothetical protein